MNVGSYRDCPELPELEPFAEAELIGFGWLGWFLEIVRTLALIVIAIALVVR